MNFRRFYLVITIRSLLIGITSWLLLWSLQQDYMPVTTITILFLWLFQIYLLVKYQGKLLKDITRFFEALQFRDVSPSFTTKNPDLKPLFSHMDRLMVHFSLVRREKEEERLLREVALEQAGVGIIILSNDGQLPFTNSEALKLLGLKALPTMLELPTALQEFIENNTLHGSQLFVIANTNGKRNLSVRKSKLVVGGKNKLLISLHDIQAEVEKTEADAWQKLIRVLTHEMVNSVQPISMLSNGLMETWRAKLQDSFPIQDTKSELEELTEALKAINTRSESLNRFIQNFRNLTLPSQPELHRIEIRSLLQQIETLFTPTLAEYNATLTYKIEPEDLTITADPKLMEQLLIILLNNALESPLCGDNKHVSIEYTREDNVIQMVVIDNGTGIPTEVAEQMFTPFFSTKPNGSGVGLSLARKIMNLHHGTITAESTKGKTRVVVRI